MALSQRPGVPVVRRTFIGPGASDKERRVDCSYLVERSFRGVGGGFLVGALVTGEVKEGLTINKVEIK